MLSQTKVSGVVIDDEGEAIAFANVFFKNSTEGTVTNEDGRFYLESELDLAGTLCWYPLWAMQTNEIALESRNTFDMKSGCFNPGRNWKKWSSMWESNPKKTIRQLRS